MGSRCTTRRRSGNTHSPGARHAVLPPRRRRQRGSARGLAAGPAAVSGPRGASWNRLTTQHQSCAAHGGLSGGSPSFLPPALAGVLDCEVEQVIEMPKILQHTASSRSSLPEPQTAEQLVAVPVIEFIVFRRHEGELGIAVCRDARTTWMMRAHDTGWSRAVYKNWAKVRLCNHARQVPAVFFEQWMVPLFSSSTEWWILPLCSETGTHSVTLCFFGLVIDMPVVVHVKVDYPVMAQRLFPLVHAADH